MIIIVLKDFLCINLVKIRSRLPHRIPPAIDSSNEANQIRTYLLSLTLLCIYCVYIKTRFTNAIRIWSNLKWNETSCVSNCQNSAILKISVYEKFVNEIHMFQLIVFFIVEQSSTENPSFSFTVWRYKSYNYIIHFPSEPLSRIRSLRRLMSCCGSDWRLVCVPRCT